MNNNYKFIAWDNDQFTPASFNNLVFNANHPTGPLTMREEMKPFGKTIITETFQQIGAKDKNEENIFIGSILKFSYLPENEYDPFYNSNLGKAIKKGLFDELILVIEEKSTGFLGFNTKTFFIKGNKFLTQKEYYEMDDEEVQGSEKEYSQLFSEISFDETFLRYLLGKNSIEIIGHVKSDPELLPVA